MPGAVGLLGLCLLACAGIGACGREDERARETARGLPVYTGRAVEPVYSSSHVTGAHGRHVFPPALQGDVVRHDFLIENTSDAVLELRDVEACSGCIVDSYSRSIQPGRTGRISTLFLTDSRGGQDIGGTIRAVTNDGARPEVAIDVSLHVKEFASVSPYRIWLKGASQQEIVETCTVIPGEDYPFRITGIQPRKGIWFEFDYQEIQHDGRGGYEITVRNTRTRPGPYQDVLFVQTDHPDRPEFKIRIEGRIGEQPHRPSLN